MQALFTSLKYLVFANIQGIVYLYFNFFYFLAVNLMTHFYVHLLNKKQKC